MYKFLSSTQSYSKKKDKINEMRSPKGLKTSHVMGTLYRSLNLMEQGISPVFVFDGEPLDLKEAEIKNRNEQKEFSERRKIELEQKGDFKEALKFSKRCLWISEEEIDLLKRALVFSGTPIQQAKKEADHKLRRLEEAQLIDGVMSDDSDLLMYGINYLVKSNFKERSKAFKANQKIEKFLRQNFQPFHQFFERKVAYFNQIKLSSRGSKLRSNSIFLEALEVVQLSELLSELELSQSQLIDFGIMIGTDYNTNPYKLGPATALKLIKEFESLDNIMELALEEKKLKNFDFECLSQFREIQTNFREDFLEEDIPEVRFIIPKLLVLIFE